MDLVSCVLPTRNRAAWIPQAIASFQSQTYEPRELVILDNGDDGTEALIPPDPRIYYERLPGLRSTGAMRNVCAEAARGTILCHFDSDDWSAPSRVASQVASLGDRMLTGFHTLLFYDTRDGQTYQWATNTPYAVGTSLCYRKAWWEGHPFSSVNVGEDLTFFKETYRKTPVRTADGCAHLVARLHGEQTCRKSLRPPRYQPVAASRLPVGFPR